MTSFVCYFLVNITLLVQLYDVSRIRCNIFLVDRPRSKFLLFLIPCFILGCSFHYDQGLELEKQKRWAEAAIEYRLAAVDNPDDKHISAALKRMNIIVAQENFESYKQYLKKKALEHQ